MLEILLILSLAVTLIFVYVLFFLEEKTTKSTVENSSNSSSSLPPGQKDEVLIYDSGWKAKVTGYIPPVLAEPSLTVGQGAEGNSTSIVVGKEAKAFSNSNSIVIGNDSYTKKEKSIVLGNNSVLEIEDESHIAIQTDGIEALDKGDLELEEDLFISLKYNGESLWIKAFDPNKFAYFKVGGNEHDNLISNNGEFYLMYDNGLKTYKKTNGTWSIFNSMYYDSTSDIAIYRGNIFVKKDSSGDFYLVTLTESTHSEKFLFNEPDSAINLFYLVLTDNVFACLTSSGITYCDINQNPPVKKTIANSQIMSMSQKGNDIIVSFFDSTESSFKLYGWNGTILYEKTDLISIPSEVNLNVPVFLFSFGDFLIFVSNNEIHINNIVVPLGVGGLNLFISEDKKVVAYATLNPNSFNIYDVNPDDNSLSARKLPIGPIPLTFSNNGDFAGLGGVYEWKTFL